jgi:hypothetical protein
LFITSLHGLLVSISDANSEQSREEETETTQEVDAKMAPSGWVKKHP